MQRPLKTLLCLLPLALAACETSVPSEQVSAPPPPPPVAAPAAPAEAAPAAAPPVAEVPPPAAVQVATTSDDHALPAGIAREVQPMPTIGVVACDSYVEAVRACLNDGHIKGGDRVKVRSALAKQVKAWSAQGKQPDIETCVAARGEARTQLKQYGCANI